MSDVLVLHGKEYTSSKRAAEITGYARDYIGQMARGGLIDAQRVGGLWYVSMDSIDHYRKNAENIKAASAPTYEASRELESIVTFEGKDYISASRASKITGYHQDYVGQLARGGKVPSRQIGNRWYVDRAALLAHKSEKDALLAAVQAEAVGLKRAGVDDHRNDEFVHHTESSIRKPSVPTYVYHSEIDKDLLPVSRDQTMRSQFTALEKKTTLDGRNATHAATSREEIDHSSTQERGSLSGKSHILTVFPRQMPEEKPLMLSRTQVRVKRRDYRAPVLAVATIIALLSIGFAGISYAPTLVRSGGGPGNMVASVNITFEPIGDFIENIVAPEIVYVRK